MSGMYISMSPTSISKSQCIYFSRTTCCSKPANNKNNNKTPKLLTFAVNGVTQILRFFTFTNGHATRDSVTSQGKDELAISGIEDVLDILKEDYDNAYFVTGVFTSSIYVDDCLFEDPTIRFRGTELYARNLRLLVPFFQQPSIVLKSIEKGADSRQDFVLANWSLRTYLKLPWRPLISIEGSTMYDLNDEYKIIRHAESWNVSALEAVAQIFKPGFGSSSD